MVVKLYLMGKEFILLFIIVVCVYLMIASGGGSESYSAEPRKHSKRNKRISFNNVVGQRKYNTKTGNVGPDELVKINDELANR